MTNELPTNHAERISAHYAHAKAKHPHFADTPDYFWNRTFARRELANARRELKEAVDARLVTARHVLNCEVLEIYNAWHRGNFAAAVEECYDAVAVLLRMAEMIEAEAVQAEANAAAKEAQND